MNLNSIRIAIITIVILVVASGSWSLGPATFAQQTVQPPRDYPVKPVPFTNVHFNDGFWAPRIEVNRTVSIPFAFEKCEETGRITNFLREEVDPPLICSHMLLGPPTTTDEIATCPTCSIYC